MKYELDVAVVGAGVSGAYAAWRLASDPRYRDSKIEIFEASHRVGGRLWTLPVPGDAGLHAEVGGMRFHNEDRHVHGIGRHLGLAIDDWKFGDDRNLSYLRGERFSGRGLADGTNTMPFELDAQDRRKSPDEIMAVAIAQIAPGVPSSPEGDWARWKQKATFRGRPLYEWSIREALREVLSEESWRLAVRAEAYESILCSYSAADMIEIMLSHRVAVYNQFRDGYDALPKALVAAAAKEGVDLRPGRRLRTLRGTGEGTVELLFDTADGPQSVVAGRVILALPKASIQQLDPRCEIFDSPDFREMMGAVDTISAAKIFLGYDKPWWKTQLGIENGALVSDTPLRQTVYFGGDERSENGVGGLLLAAYCDASVTGYWKMIKYWDEERFECDVDPALAPPKHLVRLAHAYVEESHGVTAEAPIWAAYQDWDSDPFGGGWALWKQGVVSSQVQRDVQHPIEGLNLFICGDSWAVIQGWVDGALEATESMIRNHFDVGEAQWARGRSMTGA